MPLTTLVPGTVITSAWANANVRDQTVTPFASSAARAASIAAISTVPEGFVSYLTDYDDLWVCTNTVGPVHKPYAGPPTVYKTVAETVNNSTAYQDDDILKVSVAPNAYYEGKLYIFFTSTAVAGFKVGFTAPAGAVMEASSFLVVVAGTLTLAPTNALGVAAGIVSNGNPAPYFNTFTLTTAATAGTLQFQWAQNTAQATNTTVNIGSYLRLRRIG